MKVKENPAKAAYVAAQKVIKDGLGVYPDFVDLSDDESADIIATIKEAVKIATDEARKAAEAAVKAKYKLGDGDELNDVEVAEAQKLSQEDKYVVEGNKLSRKAAEAKEEADALRAKAAEKAAAEATQFANDPASEAKEALESTAADLASSKEELDLKSIPYNWITASNSAWNSWEAYAIAAGGSAATLKEWLDVPIFYDKQDKDSENKITRADFEVWSVALTKAGIPIGLPAVVDEAWASNLESTDTETTAVEDEKKAELAKAENDLDDKKKDLAETFDSLQKAQVELKEATKKGDKDAIAKAEKEVAKINDEYDTKKIATDRSQKLVTHAKNASREAASRKANFRQIAWDAYKAEVKSEYTTASTTYGKAKVAHDKATEAYEAYNKPARLVSDLATRVKGAYDAASGDDTTKAAADAFGWEEKAADIPTAEKIREITAGAHIDLKGIKEGILAAAEKGKSYAFFEYLSSAAIEKLDTLGYVVTQVDNKLGVQTTIVKGEHVRTGDKDFKVDWTHAKVEYTKTDYTNKALGGAKA